MRMKTLLAFLLLSPLLIHAAEPAVQSWLQVDLELNRQKNTDPLRQRDADRAMREELRLPASVRGAA